MLRSKVAVRSRYRQIGWGVADDAVRADAASTEQLPSAAQVARWVREEFRLDVNAIAPVRGGADPSASVWRATTSAGGDYAVKWSARRARTGYRLLDSLADAGLDTMARAVLSRDGSARVRHDGGRLTVSAWFGERDAALTGLDLTQWEEYGRLLADLHAHRFDPPAGPMRGLRRGIRRRRHRYLAGIRELDGVGEARGRTAAAAGWRAARPRIAMLLAGAALRPSGSAVPVPCHGDPHLGNVRVSADRGLRLIDWDDAVVAPREVDLHLVEFPILFAPIAPEQLTAFRLGYGDAVIDEVRMVRFACVRALEDLVASAQAALGATDEKDRAEGMRLFEGILSPVGSASLVEPRLRALRERPTSR